MRNNPLKWTYGLLVLVSTIVGYFIFSGDVQTLTGNYSDHLHHAYSAYAFMQIGYDVFTVPLGQWPVQARFAHETFPDVPHLYPFGSILLFLPFGLLSNFGILPDTIVHLLMVSVFGSTGVISIWIYWKHYQVDRAVRTISTLLVAFLSIYYGYHGFFDVVAFLIAIISLVHWERNIRNYAIILLVISLSLQYRIWYLGPLFVYMLYKYASNNGIDRWLEGSVIFGTMSFLPFLGTVLSLEGIESAQANPDIIPLGFEPITVIALLLTVIISYRVWKVDNEISAVTAMFCGIMVILLPQWRVWYPLLLMPLPFVAQSRQGKIELGIIATITGIAMNFGIIVIKGYFIF